MPHVLAAEGGYQAFTLHGGEWAILAFSGSPPCSPSASGST